MSDEGLRIAREQAVKRELALEMISGMPPPDLA